jgi:hypothetical protein
MAYDNFVTLEQVLKMIDLLVSEESVGDVECYGTARHCTPQNANLLVASGVFLDRGFRFSRSQ